MIISQSLHFVKPCANRRVLGGHEETSLFWKAPKKAPKAKQKLKAPDSHREIKSITQSISNILSKELTVCTIESYRAALFHLQAPNDACPDGC